MCQWNEIRQFRCTIHVHDKGSIWYFVGVRMPSFKGDYGQHPGNVLKGSSAISWPQWTILSYPCHGHAKSSSDCKESRGVTARLHTQLDFLARQYQPPLARTNYLIKTHLTAIISSSCSSKWLLNKMFQIDGNGDHLLNIGQFIWFYTAQHPKRQWSSFSMILCIFTTYGLLVIRSAPIINSPQLSRDSKVH